MLSSFTAQADLIRIDPASYMFDKPTSAGSYIYTDWTGQQLTDGIYGNGVWHNDLGNGNAHEWVGCTDYQNWSSSPVNIDFTFRNKHHFHSIAVSTQQAEGGLYIPSVQVYSLQNGTWFFHPRTM